MVRQYLWITSLIALVACGCQSPNGNGWPDLFSGMGNQRVPAPGTGSAIGGNDYYSGAPLSLAPPPTTPSPVVTTPPPSSNPVSLATPPLRWQSRAEPLPEQAQPVGSGVRQVSTEPTPLITQPAPPIIPPPSTRVTVPSASTSEPLRFSPPPTAQPIGTGVAPRQAQTNSGSLPVRGFRGRETATVPASATVAPSTVTATSFASAAPSLVTTPQVAPRYGYSADYRTLHGRLEYSQADQRWKLRYIQHDAPQGQMDQFGGSVVLANTQVLNGRAAGDFVIVTGQLGQREANTPDYAPTFLIEQVQRSE